MLPKSPLLDQTAGPCDIISARPCSAEVVAGSVDGTMRRFDVRAGLESIDDIGAPVTSVRASHDGNCLLAGCMDGGVRLLDKAGGDLLATYRGALPSGMVSFQA